MTMNTTAHDYTFNPYPALFPVKSPAEEFEFTTKDGTTSMVLNESGEGRVLIRHFGLLEVFPFALPSAARMLRFFTQTGKKDWVLDQLALPSDVSPRHPFRSSFIVRPHNCKAHEGVSAFSPAIFTAGHAHKFIRHFPNIVYVAAPEGYVLNPRFAHRLFEDN
jgi:hypothetical protein